MLMTTIRCVMTTLPQDDDLPCTDPCWVTGARPLRIALWRNDLIVPCVMRCVIAKYSPRNLLVRARLR